MSNVSSSNSQGVHVPKLRFPGFEGEWEEKSMDKIFNEIIEKNRPDLPVLSIQQGVGTVLRDSSDRRISYDKTNLNSYKVMNKGDFIIHLRSFEGGLECSKHQGISSPAYKVLRSKCLVSEAYEDYFRSYNFIQGKLSIAVTGIRDGKSIDMPSFWTIKIAIPKLNEQNKISSFLSLLNKRIEKQRQLVELLKSYKRGALSKLFPKNGENTPEYRFAGFTEPWRKRLLGELGSVSMCKRIFKEQTSEVGEIPFYKIGTFGRTADSFISRELFEEYKAKYSYPTKGTILISASGSIGRTVEFTGNDEYFQDSNIVWLTHDKQLDDTFLKCFYEIVEWVGIEGSTIKRLYNDNILKTKIALPSIEEQQTIGKFFRNIDVWITLHQKQFDMLQEKKSGLLQQLFM